VDTYRTSIVELRLTRSPRRRRYSHSQPRVAFSGIRGPEIKHTGLMHETEDDRRLCLSVANQQIGKPRRDQNRYRSGATAGSPDIVMVLIDDMGRAESAAALVAGGWTRLPVPATTAWTSGPVILPTHRGTREPRCARSDPRPVVIQGS